MVNKRSFFPEILIHPGETLKDVLEGENMTQDQLSLRTDISKKHISNIINGKSSITTETALILEKVFGMSAEFWNNIQKAYDEDKARLEEKELMTNRIEEEKEVLSKIKEGYKNLEGLGFFPKLIFNEKNKETILNNLYSFFGISSKLKNILEIYNIPKMGINFKKSKTLKLNEYNLACWLRAGEKKVDNLSVGEYSKNKLKEILPELKSMTKEDNVDISRIQELLATAGIYFSFVEGFVNVPVFGITRKYRGKAFVQVSDRGKMNDGFWFALLHELAHVQLHLNKKDAILINIDNKEEDIEKEANNWAGEYLINENDFKELIKTTPINKTKIDNFCEKQGIGISILAGRLAHHYHQSGYKDAYREVSTLRKSLEIINN